MRLGSIIEINSLLKIFIDIDIDRAFLLFLVSLNSSFSSFVNKTLSLKLINKKLFAIAKSFGQARIWLDEADTK